MTSSELTEPVRAAAITSTISPKPQPLYPPVDTKEPFKASLGLDVGLPPESTAHPSGIASPAALAFVILPSATALVD